MTDLTIETRKRLVEIGLCGPLQAPLTNVMNVAGWFNTDSIGASWVGVGDDLLVLWRIVSFITECDKNVNMRKEMFILCRTKGIVSLQGKNWQYETESLGEFTKFMELRYKDHKGLVFEEEDDDDESDEDKPKEEESKEVSVIQG